MRNWRKILLAPATTILETIEIIDNTAARIALVTDSNDRLLGTVTDGDIRRAILRKIPLQEPVNQVMNDNPIVARMNESRDDILALMKRKRLSQIPVVDEQGCVVGLELLEEIIQENDCDNWVLLMAGGLGSRLSPLTDTLPKPLLKVGNKPILETTIQSFNDAGFRRFYLSVNYKADMIEEYFGDGSRWGVDIRYIREDRRMGTAGALTLLPGKPAKPMIVMNGDLLTKVNFRQLLEFHDDQGAQATMCVREYKLQVPYGVVNIHKHKLVNITEKPIHSFFVSAGIYVLDPQVLDLIPPYSYFDMPSLFEKVIEQGRETAAFPIREYWVDVGQMADFEKANNEYEHHFGSQDNTKLAAASYTQILAEGREE